MIREPAVSGRFYNDSAQQLKTEISSYMVGGQELDSVAGLVVPHAGYMFSGKIAAQAYKSVKIPQTVLLLGPNHHGLGKQAAVYPAGHWRTPLGDVPIAEELARQLIADCSLLEADELAHLHEHSIEVQIPFLQLLRDDLQILPISLGHGELSDWLALGQQIGRSLLKHQEEVLLIASSDMNHFKAAEYTERVDHLAIEQMERFDATGLYRLVRERNISMCGVIPTVVMLEATRILGADTCRLLAYGHSGEVNGDLQSVVGYAALVVEKSRE